MNTNRTAMPPLVIPGSIPVTEAEKVMLDNGLALYVINAGTEEVVRFEIIFPSGATDNNSYALSNACHQLIDAGTPGKTALDIAENLDFYGAYLQSDSGPDWKSTALFSISRFFSPTLDIIHEILSSAVFPDDEVATWKTRNIQTLKVNSEKVSWLSKTGFNRAVFGNGHPYGFTPSEEFINNISGDLLRKFHKERYPLRDALLIVSGKIDEAVTKKINEVFGSLPLSANGTVHTAAPEAETYTRKTLHIPKKDAVQSGVRIGKRLFSKSHPDFIPLSIVNTILGGYFGSRLMSNIREDKGYTYGIGSGIVPMQQGGVFYIATETGNAVRDAAIHEIYSEIRRLIEEPVPEEELLLVKNYLVGSFQRSLDGPFALADRFKGLILHGLDYGYLSRYLQTLREITPENIMEMAGKHLQPDDMTEVIAG